METGPDAGSAEDDAVGRLTDELVRLRQRGVERVDEQPKPVELPFLDRLAQQYASGQGARPARLRRLLSDALDRYEFDESAPDAQFVKGLFADETGRWPGPNGPGELRERSKKATGIKDEREYRKYQRQRLESFAHFLLAFAPSPPEPDPEPRPLSGPASRRRLVIAAAVVAVVVIVGITLAVLLSIGTPKKHQAGTGTPSQSASSPTAQSVLFRFDNLGSTVAGGSIINVYPGAGTAAADRQSNGTYTVGETVPAVCVTTGRLVKSDPTYNETPKQSDQWVRIDGVPGKVQYATLTYGELLPSGAKLPRCGASGG